MTQYSMIQHFRIQRLSRSMLTGKFLTDNERVVLVQAGLTVRLNQNNKEARGA